MAAILITFEIIHFGKICLAIGGKSIYVPTPGGASIATDALQVAQHIIRP